MPPTPGVNGVSDKGKGREVAETPGSAGVADNGDGDDDDGPGGKGERRKKNNYKHLIKGVPGASHRLLLYFSSLIDLFRILGT